MHVGFVVDNSALDFNPCMEFVRDDLRARDHIGLPPVPSEQNACGGGTLEAQNSLEVKNAGKIHSAG
jgi:hypothetical protein